MSRLNATSQDIQHKIDSLKSTNLHTANQEEKIFNILEIADLFGNINTDSAIFYTNTSLIKAKESHIKTAEAESYYMLSYYYDQKGRTNSAIDFMKQAVKLFTELKDSSYLAGCFNNLGAYYSYGNNQIKSIEYFIKAKNLAETLNETYSLSEAYTNIGSFYEVLKDYRIALEYYQKALDIDIKDNNKDNIAFSLMNIGVVLIELQRFEDSHSHLEKALPYIAEIKDLPYTEELYLNLAYFYIETNELKKAKSYLGKAQKIEAVHNLPYLTAYYFMLNADLLLKQNKLKECIALYDKSIAISTRLNDYNLLFDLYKSKSEACFKLNRHNQAYELLLKSNEIQEQLKPNEISRILGEFEQTEAQKKEMRQIRLQQELNNEKLKHEKINNKAHLQFAIFSAIFLLLVLIVVTLYSLIKKNHAIVLETNNQTINKQKELIQKSYNDLAQKEQKLQKLNATKDKFFSIVAHDLKNPFNVLIGMSDILRNDSELKNSEEFDEIIEGMYHSATSGYNLLENLLEWSRSQTGEINFTPREFTINKIFETNKSFFQEAAKRKNIEIIIPQKKEKVYADYNMVNFIVRNLLNNAIKFSHVDSKIEISTRNKIQKLEISIKDYGIGMSNEIKESLFKLQKQIQQNGTAQETGTGLGLILCKEFVEKNNGTIRVESTSGSGSNFIFTLPLGKLV